MKHAATLTIASLLSILLFSFHFADDIVRGDRGCGPDREPGLAAAADAGERQQPDFAQEPRAFGE